MSQQRNFKQPIAKTALSESKLRLSAPPAKGARRPASLAMSVVRNQPRFTVYTNVESDRNKGILTAAMDSLTTYAFLQALREMADADLDTRITVPCKNHTYYNGERSQEPKLMSTIVLGKDREGCVYIAITHDGITPVRFIFGPTDYHDFVRKDGSSFSKSELSILYAKGYAKLMEHLVGNVLDSHYDEPPPRENRQRRRESSDDWAGDMSDDIPL